ncbi:AraC family transcriptional regulator [Paenibacillus sp. Leaf72]|uniref:AraC family transcriptional regulator n=1 Tax=Paenibacillus sp. Leaf72 TaxID=1736234 RepID=UPI000700F5A2|nr:AraC family transcriptional regulator [Paenibacillus sp. Leaf72]
MRPNMREDHHEWLEIYHFTPSAFEKSGAAWPIRVGTNIAKPNYHIGPRVAPYYYLLGVLEGQGTFIQGNKTYTLRQNDLFCLFPQVTHEYFTLAEEPLHKIFFAFDGKKAIQLLARLGLGPQSPHAPGALTPQAAEFMQQLLQLVSHSGPPNTDLARLGLFHRIWDELVSSASPAVFPRDHRSISWLQKGLEYMEIHYAEGISVESVSDYVGVNRTHFTKQFSKAYGITPVQYIQQQKMGEAKRLLAQTGYTLSEIASSIGFPDLFSFSKAFKKNVGIAPKQYRSQLISGKTESND